MSIGKNIKQAREIAGITQSELAQKIDKGFSTVQKYELDIVSPPISTLKKIADALEASVYDLLGSPQPNPLTAGMDWLESLGWKVIVYEEEEYRTVLLRNTETYEQYAITDDLLRQLIANIESYSKFQIQELIEKSQKYQKDKTPPEGE